MARFMTSHGFGYFAMDLMVVAILLVLLCVQRLRADSGPSLRATARRATGHVPTVEAPITFAVLLYGSGTHGIK
jgi:hypothetical protein